MQVNFETCRTRVCVWSTRTGGGGLVDRCDSTDGRRFTGRSASVRRPSLRSSAASEARRPASAGTPGPAAASLGRVSRLGPPDEAAQRRRPGCGECPATKLFVSSRVLSGDVLAAAGVQRTAVQRPPTLGQALIEVVRSQYSSWSRPTRSAREGRERRTRERPERQLEEVPFDVWLTVPTFRRRSAYCALEASMAF